MSKFVGTTIALIGIIFLASGLILPLILPSALLQTLIGLVLTLLGFGMTVYTGRSSGKFLAGLIALLGILLMIAGVIPTITGLPLYSRLGGIVRIGLGILFGIAGYVVYEFGQDVYRYDDDVFDL